MPPIPPMPMSPMAQDPNAAPPQQAGPAGLASLLGPAAGAAPAQSTPVVSPQQQSEAFMMQVRDLTMQIDGLAQSYPECGEDFEIAKQALVNAMTKCLMLQSQTEPGSAPQILG
jgi:hypothetical protein